jgi:ferredoxin
VYPEKCTGCKACVDACEYDAIFFNEELASSDGLCRFEPAAFGLHRALGRSRRAWRQCPHIRAT